MLKEILMEVKNRDVIFTKMCNIIDSCNINENKFKICNRNFDDLHWDFYSNPSVNHLNDVFKISQIELFSGEWVEMESGSFYDHYKNVVRKTYKSDKEFVESYCYAISGITKSWMNFYDNPDYSETPDRAYVDVYNSNVETFNQMLVYIRGLVVIETKGCPHLNIEVKDPTFKLIMNGLQLKRIA